MRAGTPPAALGYIYFSPLSGRTADRHGVDLFQRAREMGFSHVCSAPIFAPAASGDIFLIDDYERTNPTLQLTEAADAAVLDIASLAREAGLHLLLDLVLDRVAADGAMARSAPHWFYRSAGSDVIDPREAQLGRGGGARPVRRSATGKGTHRVVDRPHHPARQGGRIGVPAARPGGRSGALRESRHRSVCGRNVPPACSSAGRRACRGAVSPLLKAPGLMRSSPRRRGGTIARIGSSKSTIGCGALRPA